MILGEITALLAMGVTHPRICPLIDVFATSTSIFLAFPLVSGGDLFEWLKSIPGNRPATLADARIIFKQIVSAVQYCHEQGFCHRDLKLENILHVRNSGSQAHEPGQIRLIDFGFATVISENPLHTHFLGSGTYASPEMAQQIPYSGPDVDVWSLGVILYVLVTGKFPFRGDTPRELAQRISAGVPALNSTRFQSDPNLADVVRRCLEVDRTKRATVAQLLGHPWLVEGGDETARCKSHAVLAAEYAPATVAAMFPGPLFAGIYLKHGSERAVVVGPSEVAPAPAAKDAAGGAPVSASATSVLSAT
ncbi:CAMK/CAMKL protein kinase [Allomyces macrogynus ATCC 38327]|uniref:CAMK/CAMKL protein kinase n=1 Tax=Allomyces macrogynus (strain ATCC 38327) TaxID=578462 RepID=A0A0L0SD29_ALLM3|nr:CAMK/CAMKL protein kinase [Allomyces macrogynus ATCC 38327]|eukprot:KNE60381.1 CAMK/CAMKL protein kinase [Allomyces macrogynus ATCC 38327]